MKEDLGKEVLTPAHLQRFVRRRALLFAGIAVLMLPFVYIAVRFLLPEDENTLDLYIHWALVGLLAAMALLFVGASIAMLVYSFHPPIVVVASRVATPVGETDEIYIRHSGRWYVLYFHGYGSFVMDNYMYHDSEDNAITDNQLWRSTFPEDKFYLLLWKHTGGIINAYPCNNFEYTGDITRNRYER